MPAEITVMLDCASNYGVFKVPASKSGRQPVQQWTVDFHGSEGPAYCDCPAFKFCKTEPGEPKTCKHVDAVWEGACRYNPQWRDGPYKDGKPAIEVGEAGPVLFEPVSYTYDAIVAGEECPVCGGPMVAVRRAV